MKSISMTRLFTLSVVFFLVCVTFVRAQRSPDLDTRFISRAPESPQTQGGSGRVEGGFSSGSQAVPFGVRLLAIEPSSCSWGEEVTYDIELSNIGKSAVMLPWDVNKPTAPSDSRSQTVFTTMMVTLMLADKSYATLGAVEALYGDLGNALTLRRVAPGASVVIRLPTKCVVYDDRFQRSIGPSGSLLRVFAEVHLGPRDRQMTVVAKSNEMEVTVSRLERP
jgi:hypothetical protein